MLADAREAVVEGVALAHLLGVEAREHDGSRLLRNGGGIVGAVVGHHEDVDKLLRVVLHADAVYKVADNRVLVAGGNDDGVAVVLLRLVLGRLFRKRDEHVDDLVQIADREHDEDAEIEDVHERNGRKQLV